jgi:ABC-type uncharacterized transport system substrate-binding protein
VIGCRLNRGEAHEAAGIHHAARRRSDRVAARGARAAGRAEATDRRAREHKRSKSTGSGPAGSLPASSQQLGWSDGGNVHIETRWAANDLDRDQRYAAELVAIAPDVILASSSPSVVALQRLTRTVPIVFVRVADPLGAGFVETLARPGANITGFMLFEYSLSGKWLELLKQIAPGVTHAAVIRDPGNPAGIGEFAAIQSVAPSLGIDLRPVNSHDAGEIERAIVAVSRSPDGGLIVTPGASVSGNRELIVALANRYKLAAVYSDRSDVTSGLISYGPDRIDQFRRAAGYVDRILRAISLATCRCRRQPSTN